MGEDLGAVLSLAYGDLGCKVLRAEVALTGEERERTSGSGAEVVLRMKLEGFATLLAGEVKPEPLALLVKRTGSTFSKLSMSIDSALRLPTIEGTARKC